jgi:hypothetical protein
MDSVSLIASMQRNIIIPFELISSNIINAIPLPFVGYPSVGKIISQILNPSITSGSVAGYGYFILTEGFNFIGWSGIIYNAVMIKIILSIWRFFEDWDDIELNEYMISIVAMSLLGLIRGQSSIGIKMIFYAFIPSLVIFFLISNKGLGYLPGYKKQDTSLP